MHDPSSSFIARGKPINLCRSCQPLCKCLQEALLCVRLAHQFPKDFRLGVANGRSETKPQQQTQLVYRAM